MKLILIIVATLLSYISLWFVINLVIYYLSIFTKKKVILETFHTVSNIFLYIYNIIFSISLFWIGIELFKNREYFWLIFYIFVGSNILGGLFGIITIPFIFVQTYFATKLEGHKLDDGIIEAEILNEKGKVIGITEGDSVINRKLSGYFLGLYFFNLISMYFHSEIYSGYSWTGYLLTSFIQILSGTVIFGVPYVIYHKIRYKIFCPQDKRYLLITVWKISLLTQLIFAIFSYLVS